MKNHSEKSLRRLVFALANAKCDWGAMVTLTFRVQPCEPKAVLRRWLQSLRDGPMRNVKWAWVMEFQQRGVVHFHVLLEREILQARGWLAENFIDTMGRGKKERRVIRGPLEHYCVTAWIRATRDDSPEFLRFQWGGIVEPLRSDNGAAHYFGSYLAKRDQKELPFGLDGCGRWWAMSAEAKPIAVDGGHLTSWPFNIPLGMVFDASKLDGCIAWNSENPNQEKKDEKPARLYEKRIRKHNS